MHNACMLQPCKPVHTCTGFRLCTRACRRGELQCIGATTLDEYRKHIEKDPALER